MDHHFHQQQQPKQQQQQDHEDLLASLDCDCWLEDDEQYLSPGRAWTSDPYHHLPPPPPPFGVWDQEMILSAGGLCGILTTSLIYPINVAKTLYQKALLSAGARPDRRSHSSGLGRIEVSQYQSSEAVC
ncbi:hypothetical protein KC340_g2365 [Hortaea werneckii]|nr:hypothetical protein KC342_g490 [Hortaea werneckii]KAI7107247.1 hypothetical protein KC339_g2519 [Hortaea werneckii]KAI7234092.1 hypothetical protein KC365_g6109 [Hortaea werneckii]KAI7334716.1 hypothetical protein KC340_g2365 [Hortaea werneckii]KAI7407430.1 hypothetical protein KC328_g531 [Hortaea werneckii]